MLNPVTLEAASASACHLVQLLTTTILQLHSFFARFLKAFAICAAFFSTLSELKLHSGL